MHSPTQMTGYTHQEGFDYLSKLGEVFRRAVSICRLHSLFQCAATYSHLSTPVSFFIHFCRKDGIALEVGGIMTISSGLT